jgi:hypothetical protein
MVHGEHEVIHRRLLSGWFLFALVVKTFKIPSEFDPLGSERLRMKFELALGTVNAFEHSEEIECVQVNSTKFALMFSSHIYSTVGAARKALQNDP